MAIQSNYDWEPAPAGGASWIKPLMILAVIISFGLHFGLYSWFQKIVIPAEEAPTRSAIESLKEFKIRGVINEEAKKEDFKERARKVKEMDMVNFLFKNFRNEE